MGCGPGAPPDCHREAPGWPPGGGAAPPGRRSWRAWEAGTPMAPRPAAPQQMGPPARRAQSAVAVPGLALTDGAHRWEKLGQEALGAHAPPRPARWRPGLQPVPARPENSGARPNAFSVGLSPGAWYVWPIAAPLNVPAGLLVRRRQFTQTPPRGVPSTVQAASADGRGLGIWRRRGTRKCQRPLPAWAMRVGPHLVPAQY